jgi:hypothetical protein
MDLETKGRKSKAFNQQPNSPQQVSLAWKFNNVQLKFAKPNPSPQVARKFALPLAIAG